MDMANTGVARGKIYLAHNKRQPIPEGWAIDKDGAPTTDPQAAIEGIAADGRAQRLCDCDDGRCPGC